mmetsp:Transcript_10303/g.34395  ORF Transcript_10303/g.34395 Transcript_10303/m.34395 type:complete len:197 (+) Transcript_10303:708-1298(+)
MKGRRRSRNKRKGRWNLRSMEVRRSLHRKEFHLLLRNHKSLWWRRSRENKVMMFPTGGLREGRTSCEFPTASYISFYTNIADPCIYISSLPVRPIPSFSLDLFLDNGPLQVIQLSQGKLHLLQRLAGRFAVLHELRADLSRPLPCQMSRAAADRRRGTCVLLPALEGADHVLVGVEDGEGKTPEEIVIANKLSSHC